jgi:NitT/TauT family transport system permease protein
MAWQATCLIESLDAVDNVLLVAGDDLDEASAKALLLEVLPASAVGIPVSELSGGERRRVEVVRALAARGSAVLLDEPFASLDEESHARLADFVMRHLDGRTLVAATHDLSDVAALDAAEVSVAAG